MKGTSRLLRNKDEIKLYLGGVSDHTFKRYVRMGMPARYEDCNWMAHTDNIDEFFRKYTNINSAKFAGVDDADA